MRSSHLPSLASHQYTDATLEVARHPNARCLSKPVTRSSCNVHGAKRPCNTCTPEEAPFVSGPHSLLALCFRRQQLHLFLVFVSSAVGGSKVVPIDLVLLHKGQDELVLPEVRRHRGGNETDMPTDTQERQGGGETDARYGFLFREIVVGGTSFSFSLSFTLLQNSFKHKIEQFFDSDHKSMRKRQADLSK